MSGLNLQLRKFKPENMPNDATSIFVAKRRSGKSVAVKDIMWHKRNIPCGIVCNGTEEGNSFYGEFIPDLFVYSDFDKDAIERVIQRQRKLVNGVNKDKPGNNAFIVLDDCMYDTKFVRDTQLRTIFLNGRHYKIFFLMTLQYAIDLPPALRANCDFVFVFKEPVLSNREKLYKNFFGIFPTFEMFNKVLEACTEDYGCLVLDNTVRSNKISDCVFWWKATLRKNFRVGSPQLWNMHKKMYNPRHMETDNEKVKTAKKGTSLKITKRR